MQKRIAKESKAKAANESKTAPSCCWQQADDEMQMKVREKQNLNLTLIRIQVNLKQPMQGH